MAAKNLKNLTFLASLCGIFGPAIMGLGMLGSGLVYVGVEGQRYNPLNHFVSELGELGVSEGADLFNWGLILGGSLTTVFVVFLATQIEHWIKYPLGLLSVFTTVNGTLVGFYPMNFLEPHIQVAMRFFNLGMLMTFLYSLVFLFTKWHPFPRWMAAPGLVNAAFFAWFLNIPSDFNPEAGFEDAMGEFFTNRPDFIPMALLEWVVILGILIWALMLGGYMLWKRKKLNIR